MGHAEKCPKLLMYSGLLVPNATEEALEYNHWNGTEVPTKKLSNTLFLPLRKTLQFKMKNTFLIQAKLFLCQEIS